MIDTNLQYLNIQYIYVLQLLFSPLKVTKKLALLPRWLREFLKIKIT